MTKIPKFSNFQGFMHFFPNIRQTDALRLFNFFCRVWLLVQFQLVNQQFLLLISEAETLILVVLMFHSFSWLLLFIIFLN